MGKAEGKGAPMERNLDEHGIRTSAIHWNATTPRLYEAAIQNREGSLAQEGPLVVTTVPHTGRSPNDKFIIEEPGCRDAIWWGEVNRPLAPERFSALHRRMLDHVAEKDLYVQDCFVGASPRHRLPIRVITERAWHSLLACSLFIRPDEEELESHRPRFTVLCVPSFTAEPERDGVRSGVFILVNFSEKLILIGGTEYGGEIKKSIFTVMNYLLPRTQGVLPMHCSANVGAGGDTALFFGLSGTGKTTLSADPKRFLIGDDEHGWDEEGVFNFEGGCYAKVINLSEVMEPEIFACTRRFGTIMENVVMDNRTRTVDLDDASLTENTRAFYPLDFIPNAVPSGRGGHPKNLIMLTCDAFGVLPPLSRLTPEQAVYHFLSGYTAKLAGTEDGMGKEPQAVFSACFGAPFLPLHPSVYAELLREKIARHHVRCWLVNTGWIGGGYGVGARIRIDQTRALINAALDGLFDTIPFVTEPFFGLSIPTACPDIPERIFSPRGLWADGERYDAAALSLAGKLRENFRQFETLLSHGKRE
jgi:phosphoenolpyruvate carboxykinase (ATP)